MFANTLSLCSSLISTDQVSHPYKTTGVIILLLYIIYLYNFFLTANWRTKITDLVAGIPWIRSALSFFILAILIRHSISITSAIRYIFEECVYYQHLRLCPDFCWWDMHIYSTVCYNERCYNERMLQRTVFINKIRMLQRTRRNTIGRRSTRVRVTCRAFPLWFQRQSSSLLSFVGFSYQFSSVICSV